MRQIFILFFTCFFVQLSLAQDAALGITSHHIGTHSAEERGFLFPYGSLVRSIYPNSGAEAAGLKPFDYIYQVNDQKVAEDLSLSDILDDLRPGEPVTVYYERQGRLRSDQLTLSNSDDLESVHRSSEQDPFLGVASAHYKVPDELTGVPVNVVNNSTAQAMRMEDGDIITKIDGNTLYSWSDLHAAIDDRQVGDNIDIQFYRDGNLFEERRPIKSRAATHNSHSRADGPVIVGGKPDPEAAPSQVALVNLSPEIEAPMPQDLKADMPLANNITFDQLNVFPNPSDGIFNIQLDLPQEGRTSIQVFDSQGQRVYENNLGNFSGIFSDRIDIASTAKGIYFLLVRQNDRTLSKQLVLQ